MNLQEKRIEEFLESACRFVSTEERANDIQDELRDHISNYIEEYRKEGMDYEEATNEALKQMGDPKILRELYKEKILPKKKFKLIVIGILYAILIYSVVIGNIKYAISYPIVAIALSIVVFSYTVIIRDFRTANKLRKSLSDKNALFYIQNHKDSSIWTTFPKSQLQGMCLLTAILNFTLLIIGDGAIKTVLGFSVNALLFLVMMIINLPIAVDKEVSIIYEDGIFICDEFISWDKIDGYRWNLQTFMGKSYRFIEFKKKGKILNATHASVSDYQVSLIDEVLNTKNIRQRIRF